MTARAWRQIRRAWRPPATAALLTQSYVAGPLFSALRAVQAATTAGPSKRCSLAGCVVVLGYWRSGTTLLHGHLCHDRRFGFPTTYACMHPQHFVLTQSQALARSDVAVRRPMDDVLISPGSPQEDEFALLGLGARSPYEALLAPSRLAEALALGDPRDLPPQDARYWRETFLELLRGLSLVAGGRPLILKSPPHAYRVATLRELLPDARFVLIVRSPQTVFESSVHMWRSLCALYGLEAMPAEEATRRAVLADRPRFESKLDAGLEGLPRERLARVRYEELVRDPVSVIGALYEQLELGGFAEVEQSIRSELAARGAYTARNARPSDEWSAKVRVAWRDVFEKYGYEADARP